MKENNIDVRPVEVFFSILGWTMFILVNTLQIIIAPFVLLLTFLFDRERKTLAYLIKFFSNVFYFLNFVQRNHVDRNCLKAPKKGERRIYVLNHASMFDVILIYLLPGPIKSLMKESYTKIPIIGWIAVLAGNIVLKEDIDNRIGVYVTTVKRLENGSPVVIFPEGTKSKDSKIGKFYFGTFKIALETKSDLVPVVFDTWNVIRPGGLWIRDVDINIRILDTVKYDDFKDMEYKELSDIFRIKLMQGLLDIRDERRNKKKYYYRKAQKYIDLDNEMREELKTLKEKYHKGS
jgi:1-acyl-sn-glycerol-3-phosphate acyltransferase